MRRLLEEFENFLNFIREHNDICLSDSISELEENLLVSIVQMDIEYWVSSHGNADNRTWMFFSMDG